LITTGSGDLSTGRCRAGQGDERSAATRALDGSVGVFGGWLGAAVLGSFWRLALVFVGLAWAEVFAGGAGDSAVVFVGVRGAGVLL